MKGKIIKRCVHLQMLIGNRHVQSLIDTQMVGEDVNVKWIKNGFLHILCLAKVIQYSTRR